MKLLSFSLALAFGLIATLSAPAAEWTRESVLAETMQPFAGPSIRGVDTGTLSNKVMCGYQGWFNAEDDGAERGSVRRGTGEFFY